MNDENSLVIVSSFESNADAETNTMMVVPSMGVFQEAKSKRSMKDLSSTGKNWNEEEQDMLDIVFETVESFVCQEDYERGVESRSNKRAEETLGECDDPTDDIEVAALVMNLTASFEEDEEVPTSKLEKIRKKKRMIEEQISRSKHGGETDSALVVTLGNVQKGASSTTGTSESSRDVKATASNDETSTGTTIAPCQNGKMIFGIVLFICLMAALILVGISIFWPLE